ncbi:hypothetical protein [Kibdelosporangium philippinense]|uniref:hypothetical protein n=1 Tax=Kibdelosporangium philippinense TaxID=211113 RepID=UPI00361A0F02
MAEVVPAAATKTPGMGKALVQALWFPAFFVVGFMVFYLVPFHAPAPHHVPVAVVGQQAEGSLSTALEQRAPALSTSRPLAPSRPRGKPCLIEMSSARTTLARTRCSWRR